MKNTALAVVGLLIMAAGTHPVQAQFGFGAHGAYIASGFSDFADIPAIGDDLDLSGSTGVGARLVFAPPALPFSLYGSGTYFFPTCDAASCSYWTGGFGAQLGMQLTALRPYLLGGWQWRNLTYEDPNVSFETRSNAFAGVGVEFDLISGLFVEGQWEFPPDVNVGGSTVSSMPLVVRAGIQF